MTNSEGPIRFAVLAADTALFTLRDGEILVQVIKVERPPYFVNTKGLPGGLLDGKEEAEHAARRHIDSKTNVPSAKAHFEQLYTFDRVDRDPRGRVVAVAYLALVPWERLAESERTDTSESMWVPVKKAKHLAYDHDEVLSVALKRLRSRIKYTSLISKLMPKEFTLTDLEKAYESVLGVELDKRNFRKKILKLGLLEEVKGKHSTGRFRPAQLYTFTSARVEEIEIL